ncbi:MAG TPA: PIN domain-containing protein [Candidatus Limnocylindrales bacterium]|nr:PIN domain-containing protein [Candidatus Limnocylindrales bacterium]
MRAFVDTNVLVYAVDRADPERQAAARALLDSPQYDFVLSAQVLAEFYVVTTRKLAEPVPEATAQAMVDALAPLAVVPIDAPLVQTAIGRARSWGLSLWDALILRAAEAGGCEVVLSEDFAADRTYDGIRVVNPFAETPRPPGSTGPRSP